MGRARSNRVYGPGLLMKLAIKGYDAGSTPAHQIANLRACSSASRMLRGHQNNENRSWVRVASSAPGFDGKFFDRSRARWKRRAPREFWRGYETRNNYQ